MSRLTICGVTPPRPCFLAQQQLYYLGVLNETKNTAIAVPRDVAQLLYQGVLCVEIVVWFHGKRLSVILFTPVRKVWPSLAAIFTKICVARQR